MKSLCLSAASVLALSGSAVIAQPTIDGMNEAFFGSALWTNPNVALDDNMVGESQPCTTFGNDITVAWNMSNIAGVGGAAPAITTATPMDLEAVNTGIEIAIPFSAFPFAPTTSIKAFAIIGGSGGGFKSNQWTGGGNPTFSYGNWGNGNLDLTTVGEFDLAVNYVETTLTSTGAAFTMDGSRDAGYPTTGAGWSIQNQETGFGDSMSGLVAVAQGGSEMNNNSITVRNNGVEDVLYLHIGGNLEGNFNKMIIFFDIDGGTTGFNTLPTDIPSSVAEDWPGNLGRDGLTFDAGFLANCGLELRTGSYNDGGTPGTGSPAEDDDSVEFYMDGFVFGATGPDTLGGFAGFGNTGVTTYVATGSVDCSTAPTATDPNYADGSEFNQLFAEVDQASNTLNILLTGNLNNTANTNEEQDKGWLIFDTKAGGQGTMLTTNVNLGIANQTNSSDLGAVNALGSDLAGTATGLTFDAGFEADYLINVHKEDTDRFAADATNLNTTGVETCSTATCGFPDPTIPLDYTIFDGARWPDPVTFDGIRDFGPGNTQPLEYQNTFITPQIFGTLAPNHAYNLLTGFYNSIKPDTPDLSDQAAFNTYVAANQFTDLISINLDNSNTDGVDESSAADAATATKGIELSINLEELEWDRSRPIKLVAFTTDGPVDVMSNQVLGLPAGTGTDLGDPASVDFTTISGDQFIGVVNCLADYSQDGTIAVGDILDFLAGYSAANPYADTNGDGTFAVGDILDFLALWATPPADCLCRP